MLPVAVAVLGASLAPVAVAWGWVPPWVGALAWLLSAALLMRTAWRHAAAGRTAARLCGDPTLPIAQSLAQLAGRLAENTRRATNRHPVTGLPTREQLFAAIAEADATGPRLLGVIRFVDYDRLAAFDQDAANLALDRFAHRLVRATAAGNLLVQVDRDCFGLWFHAPAADAAAEFRALLYVAAQALGEGDALVAPVTEAGSAILPDDAEAALPLLARAMASLARPGLSSTGEILLAPPPPAEVARARFRLEQDLAVAMDGDQLSMMFQPVVDLAAGRLIGAEALLRWQHPTLGPISPASFMPVVDAAGMSDRFGLWVLNAACREARAWQDAGLSGLRMAVNLSARQLHDPMLLAKIQRTLARHGLAPQALELELTETAAMADIDRTSALFAQLGAIGVSLAIDDFGSGYSSLSYLKNLPFDKLKIDREFVTDVHLRRDSRAICQALVALGQGLGLTVLAEGVEDAREVAALRAMGCDIFQGYHFSRPLAGGAFRALAADPAWAARLLPTISPPVAQSERRLSA